MTPDTDQTKIVSARLEPHEIQRLDEIAASESRHRSQQIAHFIRAGIRAESAKREQAPSDVR